MTIQSRCFRTPTPSVAELYIAIYNFVLSRPDVSELTVEDPAEAFEDLRDRNDLRVLLANEQFMNEGFGAQSATASHGGGRVQKARIRLRPAPKGASGGMKDRGKMGPPVDKAWSERWRKDLKIAGVRTFLALSWISDQSYSLATISSARGDAHHVAPRPHGCAGCESVPTASQRTTLPF